MSRVTTTVFITHCFKSSRQRSRWRERRLALKFALMTALLLPLAAPLQAEPIDIAAMRVERAADGVLLSAQLRFELPSAVEDALTKGIPVLFVAEAVLLRDRWYWSDKEVASATRYMRLSYQPLTRRWRLLVSSTPIGQTGLSLGQTFDTLEEAQTSVQRISGWKIADPLDPDPDQRYFVTLRFRLDTSHLPRPFQIGLVGQTDWNLSVARTLRVPTEPTR
jgi:hypothetical protein